MRLDTAAADVVDKLRAAGITAALDPRDLDPPTVWVQLTGVDLTRFASGRYLATFNLTVIAPDTGTSQALAILGAWSSRLVAVFTTIRRGDATGILLPGGPDPMPAMAYTVDLICTDPDPEPRITNGEMAPWQ